MTTDTDELVQELSMHEKLQALRRVGRYRPKFSGGLVVIGAFVALVEGIGLSFIYPVIETAQKKEPTNVSGPIMDVFISTYKFFDVPFSLGYLIIGVALVMTVRYISSFLIRYMAAMLGKQYEKYLRTQAFNLALDAEIRYYDDEGTDNILNAIITETRYSGRVVKAGIKTFEMLSLVLMYISVMFYITPSMTLTAIILLGGITGILRFVIEPAVTIGSQVADANERVQETVQAGTQGIRDIKLFSMRSEIFSSFSDAIDKYARSEIRLSRNEIAIKNFFELSAAIVIFVLIYIGFTFTGLSLGELGIFLIAMFQLAPKVSMLNNKIYNLENLVSHALRTQEFVDTLRSQQENSGDKAVSNASTIEFDDVHFSYTDDEKVLNGISFDVSKGEFIAFVGQSGAGKSTIVSLLTRMYNPDSGEVCADGIPIHRYDIEQWRERIAVVRQNPFIFTDTLENNVTIGNRDATRQEIKRVCEIAKVAEFVNDLPNGYDSELGDDGVRLSGGQRQRVALARALLKDADFLVLDEATSDLDSSLEKEVQAAVESMDSNYGIISIAHRLSTVKNANQIYTVDEGEVIESGTHKQLLSKEGEYAEMYTIQSKV